LAFVIVGDRFALGNPAGNMGYDGQFAYYIARDPVGALAYLDNPAYRYQRILYPVLARVLSLGQPALVPWMLVLINVVSISGSTELLGRLLERRGLNRYLALLLPLWLGQVFALRADLSEPLCYLFVVIALWCHERDLHLPAAVALAASALAKEGGFLFLPAFVLVMLLQRRWWPAVRYALVVLLPYAVLQIGLYVWLGRPGLSGAGGRFELIPFYGFTFTQPAVARAYLVLFIAIPIAALLVGAAWQLLRTPRSLYAWALLVNCLLIVFIARRTAVDVLAVFRTATGVVIAALLFCGAHRLRRLAWVLHAIWLPQSTLALIIPGFLV
jgi:hypothetical protein